MLEEVLARFVAMAWLGWVLAGIMIATTVWAFWYQRKKKSEDTRSHHIVSIHGFPVVHVPVSHTREEAETFASVLKLTYDETWLFLDAIYEPAQEVGPMPIATIGSSMLEVRPAHPHVMWIAPRDKIFLRVQREASYWFAMELHNIFRYLLHGMEHIYRTVDEDDQRRADIAVAWIEETFKG